MKNPYLFEIAMDDSSTDETNIKKTTPAYSAHRNILQIENNVNPKKSIGPP